MALRTFHSLIDDLDKESIASETVSFALNGVSYEIDLSDSHQSELFAALEPYVKAARRVGGRRTVRKAASSSPSRTTAIREWAVANGHKVADRGRIPAAIVEAYDRANA